MVQHRAPIERFAWYEPWLARGAQPSPQALAWLREQGIRTVVSLRRDDAERQDVERASLHFAHIPVPDDEAPTTAQIEQWLDLCAKHAGVSRLFVHCHGGEGRTSTFCAAVRIAAGDNVQDVIADQASFGFEPDGKHKAQAAFLRELAQRVTAGEVILPALPI